MTAALVEELLQAAVMAPQTARLHCQGETPAVRGVNRCMGSSDAQGKEGPVSLITENPIAWRVWYEHHTVKLTSSKPPPPQFRDCDTREEAVEFKKSLRERFPQCVACVEPLYVASKRLVRRNRRSRQ